MEDACAQIGASCEMLGPQTFDQAEHIALLEAAIARGPDGIATTRPDPGAYDEVLQAAVDAGIAVVIYNTNDPTANDTLPLPFVGQDFTTYGQIWARETMAALPDGGTIAVTICCPGHYALEERIRSFRETLDNEGGGNYEVVEIINAGTDTDANYAAIEAFYTANPDVDMIVGSDFFTYIIGQFLVSNGLENDVIVAGEMSPFMEEGLRAGFVPYALGQGPYLQGYYPVHMIRMQVELGIQPASIDSGTDVISPANIDEWNPDFR